MKTAEQKKRHAEEQRRYRLTPGYAKRNAEYQTRYRLSHRDTLNRKERERRKKTGYSRISQGRFRSLHPEKKSAWNAVYLAVRTGKVIRPDHCERCGVECKPEAHHADYKKKLEVSWLCRGCHLVIEGKQLRGPIAAGPAPKEQK